MATYTLLDFPAANSLALSHGMRVRFFKRNEDELPSPKVGDAMLIRQIKVCAAASCDPFQALLTCLQRSTFQGQEILLSGFATSFAVFPVESIPDAAFKVSIAGGKQNMHCVCLPVNMKPDIAEQLYAIALKESVQPERFPEQMPIPTGPKAMQAIAGQAAWIGGPLAALPPSKSKAMRMQPGASAGTTSSGKFRLIQDAVCENYYDLVVQVVKMFPGPAFSELYVTDFTSNSSLFEYALPGKEDAGRDGDDYGYVSNRKKEWPGPWGRFVIKVELKPPHSLFANAQVKDGDFLKLQNVRVKSSRDSKMEANMWQDNIYPERVQIQKIIPSTSAEGEALLGRMDAYWQKFSRYKKLLPGETYQEPKPVEKQLSRKQRKKQEKAKRTAKALEKEGFKEGETMGISANKHVRCTHQDINLSTIEALLRTDRKWKDPVRGEQQLPFINQCRRAKVRVIDFYPANLQDFTRPSTTDDEESDADSDIDGELPRWRWDFFLLVEDARRPIHSANTQATPTMWLHVPHKSAEYLHKLDATDLCADQKSLNQLRELLAVLWGNLEEIKSAALRNENNNEDHDIWKGALSNVPFECCIVEYGQPLNGDDDGGKDDWIQMFEMRETTVI